LPGRRVARFARRSRRQTVHSPPQTVTERRRHYAATVKFHANLPWYGCGARGFLLTVS